MVAANRRVSEAVAAREMAAASREQRLREALGHKRAAASNCLALGMASIDPPRFAEARDPQPILGEPRLAPTRPRATRRLIHCFVRQLERPPVDA